MEKLFLALTYLTLNLGLYILFVSPLKQRFNKVVKVAFVAIFLLVCILFGVLGGQSKEEFNLSFSLLVFYFVGYVFYKIAMPFFDSQGFKISKKQRAKFAMIFLGAFTLFVTVVQLLILYDSL